jgi:hypothetical protein
MDWVTTLSAGLGQIVFFLDKAVQGLQALLSFDFNKLGSLIGGYQADYSGFVAGQNAAINQSQNRAIDQGETARRQNVTININKGNVTAKEIAKAVNKGTKVGGAPVMDAATIRRIGAR